MFTLFSNLRLATKVIYCVNNSIVDIFPNELFKVNEAVEKYGQSNE